MSYASTSLLNTLRADASTVRSLGNSLKVHLRTLNASKLTNEQIEILQGFNELPDDANTLYDTCINYLKNKHITTADAEKSIHYLGVMAENLRKAEELLNKLGV